MDNRTKFKVFNDVAKLYVKQDACSGVHSACQEGNMCVHELREPLGGRRHALREILKNRVFLMPFPAFWSGFYT